MCRASRTPWAEARRTRTCSTLAGDAGLGDDLVIQTPYGDSGQTTFFIASVGDWRASEEKIVGQEIKVMKRIEPRELAIEGVITRHGTLVGPLMAELVGFEELTPYDGGWCGDDVSPELLTESQRAVARERTIAMGDRLAAEGYRGYFELDFLLDADTGDIWLGELNPRVTGASSITNVTAVAYGDMPLFLFHLLEFMDVDYEIDVEELNERWAQVHNLDEWTPVHPEADRGRRPSSSRGPRLGHLEDARGRCHLASRVATPTGTP